MGWREILPSVDCVTQVFFLTGFVVRDNLLQALLLLGTSIRGRSASISPDYLCRHVADMKLCMQYVKLQVIVINTT